MTSCSFVVVTNVPEERTAFVTVQIWAAGSLEAFVTTYKTTGCHKSQCHNLNCHSLESLDSHNVK
jgi:hypothetical protein